MAKKIYLSPSNQDGNTYKVGGTNEMVQCNKIATAAKTALERCGFTVKKAPQGQSMYTTVAESNAWSPDLHLCIHTNAFNGSVTGGTMVMIHDMGTKNKNAGSAILNSVAPITPGSDYALMTSPGLYELNSTKGLAVYCECEFHDTVTGATFIVNNTSKIGEAIAKGICNYFGVTYKTATGSSAGSTTDVTKNMYRVRKSWANTKSQIGAFSTLKNAKDMADKNKGYYVFDGGGKKVYTPASSSAPVSKNTVTVKGKTTYIRAEGHCKAKGLKAVAVGTKLTWKKDDTYGWSYVTTTDGKVSGWLQNSRLAGKSGLSTWRIATCNGTNVQVRADATTASKSLGSIGKGKTFTVTCLVPSEDPKNPGTWIMTGGIIKGKDVYVYNGDYISIGGAR